MSTPKTIVLGAGMVGSAMAMDLRRTSGFAVIEAGRPYCDISFMPEDAWELDGLAKQHGVCAVIDCGVAPGVSNLLVGHGAAQLDTCERAEILVGGLPVVRTWPFEYKAG